MLILKLNY